MRSLLLVSGLVTAMMAPFAVQAVEPMQHDHMAHMQAASSNMHVLQGWSRALPPTAQSGAAFLTLHNMGTASDRLIALESPVAKTTELHTHLHQDGLMKMVRLDDLTLEAGESLLFEPGSYHVMLIGLTKPLVEGEQFPVYLTFEKAGKIEVLVDVKSADAKTGSAEHSEMDHSMMHH